MSKERYQQLKAEQKALDGVYIRGMNRDLREVGLNTKENVAGMTSSQALVLAFQDRLLDPTNGDRFSAKLNAWLDKSEEKKPEGDMKVLNSWLQTVTEKALLDVDQQKHRDGKESIIDWDIEKNKNSYCSLIANMETKWQAVSLLGARNVKVNPADLNRSRLEDGETLTKFKDAFGEIGDVLYDIATNTNALMRTKAARIGVPIVAAVTTIFSLTSCGNNIDVNVPIVETLAPGEALPIGLMDAKYINELPSGEVKNSLQAELNSVKDYCGTIPGCMGDTVQLYRVIVPENVYSIRFADIKTETEAQHTEVLSIMDGKAQETTYINEDLLAKEDVINGINTKAFGYVDDLGNSHYIFVDQGNKKFVYDATGNIFEVKTQNEKEVQSYSSFWGEPIVAHAESLPTPTSKPPATPTDEAPVEAKVGLERLYPVIFELPLEAEVHGINVKMKIGFTEDFAHYRGYKSVEVIKESAAADLAEAVLMGTWSAWISDDVDNRLGVTYEQWIEKVKAGNIEIQVAAVNGDRNDNKITDREMMTWKIPIVDGKPTLSFERLFAFEGRPIKTSSQSGFNFVMEGNTLVIVDDLYVIEKKVFENYPDNFDQVMNVYLSLDTIYPLFSLYLSDEGVLDGKITSRIGRQDEDIFYTEYLEKNGGTTDFLPELSFSK